MKLEEANEDLGQGVSLEMVLIPAGKFMMGSPASEKGRSDNETQHEVTLTKPFYMGKYEVTQEQWEAVMPDQKGIYRGPKLPVTSVTWEDCQEFIKKLNAKTSCSFRLPTEAEWEYACRAGTITAYSFGDEITPQDANYRDSKIGKPVAVGSYKPNAFGLYDMHGNVWEWCEDWHGNYPNESVTDPKGPAMGEDRVLRGGSFYGDTLSARKNSKWFLGTPRTRYDGDGFRLAMTINSNDMLKPNIKVFLLKAKQTEAQLKQMEVVKLAIEKELVLIPAGKFVMGSPESEKGRRENENQHEVTLTKPYYMGKYAVTQEQWESLGMRNISYEKGAKLPVTMVSWEDCQEFIKKLNKKTDGGYRLPTEAEWEYACRAGTTTAFSFGDSITTADANIDGNSTKEVGSYKPNAFGLYDMHGNVYEWCEDWHGNYPNESVTDEEASERRWWPCVAGRGGAFVSFVESGARSSFRYQLREVFHGYYVGFRLARTAL